MYFLVFNIYSCNNKFNTIDIITAILFGFSAFTILLFSLNRTYIYTRKIGLTLLIINFVYLLVGIILYYISPKKEDNENVNVFNFNTTPVIGDLYNYLFGDKTVLSLPSNGMNYYSVILILNFIAILMMWNIDESSNIKIV